jgi:hypothetical protein
MATVKPNWSQDKAKEPSAMLPPYLIQELAENHLRELRKLNEPFVTPAWVLFLRTHLADSLIRLGHALAIPEPPPPSGDATRVGLPTQ